MPETATTTKAPETPASTTNPNSLKELGFSIDQVKQKSDIDAGFVYKVRGPAPIFYIKKTKSGKLVAFRQSDESGKKTETTINGLATFTEADGDLVGSKYQPQAK